MARDENVWAVRKIIFVILFDGTVHMFEFIRRKCDEPCRQVLLIAGCCDLKMRVLRFRSYGRFEI